MDVWKEQRAVIVEDADESEWKAEKFAVREIVKLIEGASTRFCR